MRHPLIWWNKLQVRTQARSTKTLQATIGQTFLTCFPFNLYPCPSSQRSPRHTSQYQQPRALVQEQCNTAYYCWAVNAHPWSKMWNELIQGRQLIGFSQFEIHPYNCVLSRYQNMKLTLRLQEKNPDCVRYFAFQPLYFSVLCTSFLVMEQLDISW